MDGYTINEMILMKNEGPGGINVIGIFFVFKNYFFILYHIYS